MMMILRLIALNCAVLVALLVVLEGGISLLLLVFDLATARQLGERVHTRHDPDLGWANIPGIHVRDAFGPGADLRINRQGFRSVRDFSNAVPAGRHRVVCSGDSFTFGFGVDDADTWCEQLVARNPVFETVNMGQGGYGVDQAYLWYKRDGLGFEANSHIFAFIWHDFVRMQSSDFIGYAKPRLELRDGVLVTTNVPVPKDSYTFSWFTARRRAFSDTRSADFFERVGRRLWSAEAPPGVVSDADTRQVVKAVFADLAAINRRLGRQFILLFLPSVPEIRGTQPAAWAEIAAAEAESLGIRFVSLLGHFKQVPPGDLGDLFIREGELDFRAAAGHFNPRGNAHVADAVAPILEALLPANLQPAVAR